MPRPRPGTHPTLVALAEAVQPRHDRADKIESDSASNPTGGAEPADMIDSQSAPLPGAHLPGAKNEDYLPTNRPQSEAFEQRPATSDLPSIQTGAPALPEPPRLPSGTRAKVIENPWAKPSGEPSAQRTETLRRAEPVRLVRYHEPEAEAAAAASTPPAVAAPPVAEATLTARNLPPDEGGANPLRDRTGRDRSFPQRTWSSDNPLR